MRTWRSFLDFLQSSFLMQPGTERGPALSSQGPFYFCSKRCLSWDHLQPGRHVRCAHRALTVGGFTRSRMPTCFLWSRRLLITIWKTISVVGIEREVGDDSVPCFLFLVEEREGQQGVVFLAQVTELFVPCLVALVCSCSHTQPGKAYSSKA